MNDDGCPCGTGRRYGECCEPIHRRGAGLGTTAEQLMRARYCAYVRHDASFLLNSWHPSTRPPQMVFDPDLTWLGLDVVQTERGGGLDSDGSVTFSARFRRGEEHFELQELSSFVREGGRWFYLDGC